MLCSYSHAQNVLMLMYLQTEPDVITGSSYMPSFYMVYCFFKENSVLNNVTN